MGICPLEFPQKCESPVKLSTIIALVHHPQEGEPGPVNVHLCPAAPTPYKIGELFVLIRGDEPHRCGAIGPVSIQPVREPLLDSP